MKPLYQLVAQYRELQNIDAEDADDEALANTLDGLGGEITEKATNVAAFVKNLDIFAQSIENAAAEMKRRAEVVRRKADRTKAYLLNCMQGAGLQKVQAPEITVRIQRNPIAVMIAPEAKIPAEYMVTPEPPPPRPDKKKLREALEGGAVVDGVHLEQGVRLVIS
jgi:hypothetical protein